MLPHYIIYTINTGKDIETKHQLKIKYNPREKVQI